MFNHIFLFCAVICLIVDNLIVQMLIFYGTSLCYVDTVKLKVGCLASNHKEFKAFFLVIFSLCIFIIHTLTHKYINIYCFWRILAG